MKMKFSGIIFVFLVTVDTLLAYNVLGIFPHTGKSHFDFFEPVMRGLAEKGHNVTVISYYPSKFMIPNYRDIVIEKQESILGFSQKMRNLEFLESTKLIQYFTPSRLSLFSELSCAAAFRSEGVQNFLKENNTFDVMIVEFFNTYCFLPLASKLHSVTIGISSSNMMLWTSMHFANPDNPAYVPNNFFGFSNQMTFLERTENTLVTVAHKIYYNYIMLPRDKTIVRSCLHSEKTPLIEYIRNTSLLLVNTHFSLNLPRPLVPGVIEVGGIHITPPRLLPETLEKWISKAEHGVIYFSLGSMIKAKTMRKEKIEAFIKAFKRLPQRVLWKWENETLEGKPDNVLIQKWMPQPDILSHPNVKAFIGHGGLLGTIEAVNSGVPMVVMPQFGDQHTNAKAIEANGGGVILKMNEATEDTIYEALKTILNPKFQQQAKELSERFRDRPMPPLETAIYWVEYVARHKGAPHLRTAAVGMPFYQYYLLDVIAFILVVIGLFSYISYCILKLLIRKLIGGKTVVKHKTS